MAHIITILADGFEEIEAVTFIDLLRRARIKTTVLGLNTKEVRGSHGIIVTSDMMLRDFNEPIDGVVVPGGQPGTTDLANSPEVLKIVKDANSAGLLCAAICAGPTVLARAGILTGVEVTCYPGVESKLSGARISELPVVRHKNIITSRGVGTAIPFALELISYLAGEEVALKVKEAILY